MPAPSRDLPALVRSVGNLQEIDLNQGDKNRLVGSFRDAWTPTTRNALPNGSMALSVGGNDPLFGQRIGYLVSGTYSYSNELRTDQHRALAQRGSTPGSTNEIDRFDGETANQGTLWGGLLNLSTLLGGTTRARSTTSTTVPRTTTPASSAGASRTKASPPASTACSMSSARCARRSWRWSISSAISTRSTGSSTSSGVRRDEPDRTEFLSQIVNPGSANEQLLWLSTGTGGAVRTFSNLTEDSNEGRANYLFSFSARGLPQSIKVGGLFAIGGS